MADSQVAVATVLVLYFYLPGRSMILVRQIIKLYIPTDNSWEGCNYRAITTRQPIAEPDRFWNRLHVADPIGVRR